MTPQRSAELQAQRAALGQAAAAAQLAEQRRRDALRQMGRLLAAETFDYATIAAVTSEYQIRTPISFEWHARAATVAPGVGIQSFDDWMLLVDGVRDVLDQINAA